MLRRRSSLYLVIIPVVFFVLYFAWACVLPINQAPDEEPRLAIPFYIVSHGCLPNGFEPSIRNAIWGISYAFTPYGSSLLSVLFIKIATIIGLGDAGQIVAARLSSCIFGALTLHVMMRLALELGFSDLTALFSGLFLGMLPQFAFLSSYLNNDIFSAFCTALVILSWARGLKRGWKRAECILLGVSVGLLSISYYFAYALIPISVVVFFMSARNQGISIPSMFAKAGLVFFVAFAVGGWFFVRNALIYSGDFLGMRSYSECAELYAMEGFKPSDHWTPKVGGQAFMSPLADFTWVWMTFESCIGYLGYMAFPLPEALIKAAGVVVVIYELLPLRLRGSVFASSGEEATVSDRRLASGILIVAVLVSAICPILFSAYRSWATDWEPQGRYIVSSWICVGVFLSWGLDCLIRACGDNVMGKVLACLPLILLALILDVNAVMVFWPVGFSGI